MNWRFTLIDRLNVSTVISEPIGWDAIEINLKRDLEKHGVFTDYQGNDFMFNGIAYNLIKAEYEAYGLEGDITLVIQQSCNDTLEELYRGKLVFAQYESSCSDECYVKIAIETTGDVIELLNRWDQKVNLETDTAFDGSTTLPPYSHLGYNLTLPSKGIFLQNNAINENVNGTDVLGPTDGLNFYGFTFESDIIEIGFDKLKTAEIGSFSVNNQPKITCIGTTGSNCSASPNAFFLSAPASCYASPLDIDPIVKYYNGSNNFGFVDEVRFLCRVNGRFHVYDSTIYDIGLWICVLPKDKEGLVYADYNWILEYSISSTLIFTTGTVLPFDKNIDELINLSEGDRIYVGIGLRMAKTAAQITGNAYRVEFDPETFINMEALSYAKSLDAKVFLANESLSRVTEAITNNKIKVYSEYFGRTDSQPYSASEDGCGSLEAISKGLFIRNQQNRVPVTPFLMSVSMQDLWNGFEPIHHIGMGIESDTDRPGFNRLRIEPWKHFYSDDIIMECENVSKIDKKIVQSECYSTFKFGYQKWEAEDFNGLDEFLTKRSYRTTLSQIKNEFSKFSSFIASGYAIEIGKRKSKESKDWKYDNENFIVCLSRNPIFKVKFIPSPGVSNPYHPGGSFVFDYVGDASLFSAGTITVAGSVSNNGTFNVASYSFANGKCTVTLTSSPMIAEIAHMVSFTNITFNSYFVELGNIETPTNIIDPGTIYNYRLSPIRIALRWLDKILASYKTASPSNKIIFMDGDANYLAKGKMLSSSCRWENTVLQENASLDSSVFEDAALSMPILKTERIEFQYPMSIQDFKNIQANPYGQIFYSCNCEEGYGWIDDIKYKPEEGLAIFKLIPKYN